MPRCVGLLLMLGAALVRPYAVPYHARCALLDHARTGASSTMFLGQTSSQPKKQGAKGMFLGKSSNQPKKQGAKGALASKPDEDNKRAQSFNMAVGYLALWGQLTPALLTALAKLGLFNPPPINLLTDVANNAMDAAIAAGEIPKIVGTVYGQGIWKDLIGEYYSSGETTEFLTKAGGVCDLHPAWCEGITIVAP